MKPSLEEIASEIDINQEKGIFNIPENIQKRRVVRYFLRDSKKQKEHPIVILEEKYTRQSVMYKLGNSRCYSSNRNLVIALLEYKLLRTPSGEQPDHHGDAIDNLSLAQVISFAYQVPIEKVLIPRKYFSSKEFKSKKPQERIRTLFNAYTGTSWFERFKRKYKRRKSKQKFTPWHNISTADLPELLCTSDYEPGDPSGNLTKLIEAGLIIPRDVFKRFSPRNFVDVYALIELASFVTGEKRKELTNEDSYIEHIARRFIEKRLLPYLDRYNLELDQEITLAKARCMTGKVSEVLYKALRISSEKTARFYSSKTKIPAVDLAIYALKNTHMQVFKKEDIASLFDMEDIDTKRCNLYPNPNGTYARLSKVFPFYDSVVEVAKDLLKRNSSAYIERTQPTKTFEQIVRESNEIQRRFDLKARRQLDPVIYLEH